MFESERRPLDVAIVGGGVSGLYAAWRLAKGSPASQRRRTAVFEATDRLGGRLWSHQMQCHTTAAELGGMFFSDAHALTHGLCTRGLDLEVSPVFHKPAMAYVRGQRFPITGLKDLHNHPYQFAEDERAKPYHELILQAMHKIAPGLGNYWPLNPEGRLDELEDYLRGVAFAGVRLYRWSFWHLLTKVLSHEAYLCLRDLVGAYSMFRNQNAYDAIYAMMRDLTGNWCKLRHGFETLPKTLNHQLSELRVPVYTKAHVTEIGNGKADGQVSISVSGNRGTCRIEADHVLLALPKRAIRALATQGDPVLDGALTRHLDAVAATPVCKLFLVYERPWWETLHDGPGRVNFETLAKSHTDLPIRQCYYLGTCPESGRGLLLAAFCDAEGVDYWAEMMDYSDNGLVGAVSDRALQEVQRQLIEMHGVDIPNPVEGYFVNWTRPPYGGGWHSWLPGWESHKVMATLRRPYPDRNLHICGEAFSGYQGWVEGALSSVEDVLNEVFGMNPPDWLTSAEEGEVILEPDDQVAEE